MDPVDPRGSDFHPTYRPVLWLGLALSAMTTWLLAGIAWVLGYHWAIVTGLLLLPVSTVATLLWKVVYRSITFGDGTLTLGRYVFSDVTVPYDAVDDVGTEGFRTSGHAVSWKVMRNGEELERRIHRLRELGVISDEQLSGEMEADTSANRTAAVIVVGIVYGVSGGLAVTTDLRVFSWKFLLGLLAFVLVATPTLRALLRSRARE